MAKAFSRRNRFGHALFIGAALALAAGLASLAEVSYRWLQIAEWHPMTVNVVTEKLFARDLRTFTDWQGFDLITATIGDMYLWQFMSICALILFLAGCAVIKLRNR